MTNARAEKRTGSVARRMSRRKKPQGADSVAVVALCYLTPPDRMARAPTLPRLCARTVPPAVPPAGFEPATLTLEVSCSVQLSYGSVPNTLSSPSVFVMLSAPDRVAAAIATDLWKLSVGPIQHETAIKLCNAGAVEFCSAKHGGRSSVG
jgi:hypothetical protein